MSRPGAKHKHAPKVISAIENTFTIDSNIETGIVIGTECQEVIFKDSFEKKETYSLLIFYLFSSMIHPPFMQFSSKVT